MMREEQLLRPLKRQLAPLLHKAAETRARLKV